MQRAEPRGGVSSVQILPESLEPAPFRAINFHHPVKVFVADCRAKDLLFVGCRVVGDCPLFTIALAGIELAAIRLAHEVAPEVSLPESFPKGSPARKPERDLSSRAQSLGDSTERVLGHFRALLLSRPIRR